MASSNGLGSDARSRGLHKSVRAISIRSGGSENGCVPCPDVDLFDLAAVAIAVKRNDDGFNSGGGERIEQDGLVGSSNLPSERRA